MRDLMRTRWAAVGAAVAVTLGAGGVSLTQAAISSGEKPVVITVDTTRILDTRTGVGLGGGRFVDSTPQDLQVTGTVPIAPSGTAAVVPAGAVGVLVNVTVVAPSSKGFLSLRSGGAAGTPSTSTVNFEAGITTPNAATVDLSGDGKVQIWLETDVDGGNAHVLLDIVGYTIDHQHTGADIVDESLTGADVADESLTGADVDDGTLSSADTSNEAGVASDYVTDVVAATSTPSVMAGTAIRVPSDGYVIAEATGQWNGDANATVFCQLQKGTAGAIDFTQPWFRLDDAAAAYTSFSAHRVIPIAAADNPLLFNFGQTINMVCDEIDGTVTFDDIHVSATFVPTSYKPTGFIFIPFEAEAGPGASE